MKSTPSLSRLFAGIAALILVACGGGGGDSTPTNTMYAVSAAQRHLLTEGGSWTVTGPVAAGGTYTITMALSPLTAAVPISGVTAYPRLRQLLTFQQAGVAPATAGPTFFFDGQSLAILQTDNGDGTCSVATSNAALPTSASVGTSGAIYGLSDLGSCANGAGATGTTTTTWSLENDAGVVLLCWNATGKDTAGAVTGSLASCVQVAPDGALGTKARITLTSQGSSTTARNF